MVEGRIRVAHGSALPEWDVVAGARFVVALEAPAPADSVAAFVRLADDDRASLESLVASMPPAGGPSDAVGLVWWPDPVGDPGEVTLVVRGAAAVDLETGSGDRRLEAGEVHPWRLAEFAEVGALRVSTVGAHSLRPAADRSSEILQGTGLPGRATSVEWESPSALDGRRRGFADADTRVAGGPRPSIDAADEPESEPTPGRVVMRYRLDGGAVRDIRSVRVVFGRKPLGSRAGQDGVELVAIPGASASVSGSHLELRAEGRRLVATDLRSTNGVEVRRGVRSYRMRSGESIVVSPGTLLRLGGDTIIEILPPRIDPQDDRDRQAPA
ncbi:FHA domain-containing protein [Agromyces sp. MMS24-JH15]|uniref:FHA domain-containing protein n=1 Tax=Agromyces sp. MMS24-JH15 TaxID=3243765 RepID=UPI0037486CE4